LISVASNMEGNTICVLADSLSMPAKSIVPKFKDEFIEHVKLGRCPFRDRKGKPANGELAAHAA
jgi:NADH-quinone oxidoreductase subunit F